MGGRSQSENKQDRITDSQLDIQRTQAAQSQADITRRNALEQPAIDFNTLLSSGDPAVAMRAVAPIISQISGGAERAKASIFDLIAPGAARDNALAETARGANTDIASATSGAILSAPDKLANLGAGFGASGLQEIGAAISAGGAASNSNAANINADSERKATTMGFLGSLAGAGGTFAGAKFGH